MRNSADLENCNIAPQKWHEIGLFQKAFRNVKVLEIFRPKFVSNCYFSAICRKKREIDYLQF